MTLCAYVPRRSKVCEGLFFGCCVLIRCHGCADIESDLENDGLTQTDEAERGGYKNGSGLPAGGILGADCTDGCLWSSWAVSIGVQRASQTCGGAPCACVQEGAASLTCTPNGSTGGGGALWTGRYTRVDL